VDEFFFISLILYVLFGHQHIQPFKVFVLMGSHQILLFLKYEAHGSILCLFFSFSCIIFIRCMGSPLNVCIFKHSMKRSFNVIF